MFHANNISARRFGRVKSGLNLEIQPEEKFEYSAWVGKIMFLLKKKSIFVILNRYFWHHDKFYVCMYVKKSMATKVHR